MKTLAQIEPRTDVLKLGGDATDLFLITNAGSYYLTTNIVGVSGKHGIGIASGNVTLDLNGFSLLGVPGSLVGVKVNGTFTNLTVRNGAVSGWGGSGVDAYTAGIPRNVVFERLTVSANGGSGIITEAGSVVRDCLSEKNSLEGIYCFGSLISGCVSRDNADTGITAYGGVVRDCQVQSSSGDGIDAINYSVVRDCQVQSSGIYGIYTTSGSTVSGCSVQGSVYSGIYVNAPGCQISGNTCKGNNTSGGAYDAGIYINESNNRVEDNHVTASGHAGIQTGNYFNNVIIRNSVSGNTNALANNYIIIGNNALGPIISAFGIITNSNPWANFSY